MTLQLFYKLFNYTILNLVKIMQTNKLNIIERKKIFMRHKTIYKKFLGLKTAQNSIVSPVLLNRLEITYMDFKKKKKLNLLVPTPKC